MGMWGHMEGTLVFFFFFCQSSKRVRKNLVSWVAGKFHTWGMTLMNQWEIQWMLGHLNHTQHALCQSVCVTTWWLQKRCISKWRAACGQPGDKHWFYNSCRYDKKFVPASIVVKFKWRRLDECFLGTGCKYLLAMCSRRAFSWSVAELNRTAYSNDLYAMSS